MANQAPRKTIDLFREQWILLFSVFFLHQSGAELRIQDGGVNAIFDEKRK